MKKAAWALAAALALALPAAAQAQIRVEGPPPPPSAVAPMQAGGPLHISSGVMAGLLLWRVDPVYPAEARAAQIRGTVVLRATIGEDGKVAHLDVVAGPEPLRGPALDAVAQWVYKPYLLHRQPHAVETTIFVNFDGK